MKQLLQATALAMLASVIYGGQAAQEALSRRFQEAVQATWPEARLETVKRYGTRMYLAWRYSGGTATADVSMLDSAEAAERSLSLTAESVSVGTRALRGLGDAAHVSAPVGLGRFLVFRRRHVIVHVSAPQDNTESKLKPLPPDHPNHGREIIGDPLGYGTVKKFAALFVAAIDEAIRAGEL